MKYNLILENWKQFLSEQDMASVAPTSTQSLSTGTQQETEENKQEQTVNKIKAEIPKVQKAVGDLAALVSSLQEAKRKKRAKVVKKKSGDRCTRIAKRKYDVWPSAYASGAVVKCRQGKIWKGVSESATDEEIDTYLLLEKSDPKVGTGKKPKESDRRLYTDENPKDTVSVKFSSVQDIKDTLSKESFKSKSHARQSQIINLIHQRVRVAYDRAKEPEVKSRLKKALDYAEQRKEASKEKTKNLQEEQQGNQLNERCWKGYTQKGMKTMFGKRYPNCVKITKEEIEESEEIHLIEEKWSDKYKSSINCKNPKGFSQRAHCQGRKKRMKK